MPSTLWRSAILRGHGTGVTQQPCLKPFSWLAISKWCSTVNEHCNVIIIYRTVRIIHVCVIYLCNSVALGSELGFQRVCSNQSNKSGTRYCSLQFHKCVHYYHSVLSVRHGNSRWHSFLSCSLACKFLRISVIYMHLLETFVWFEIWNNVSGLCNCFTRTHIRLIMSAF